MSYSGLMRKKDTNDVLSAVGAVLADGLAIVGGLMIAVWMRFDSGWFDVPFGRGVDLYTRYTVLSIIGALLFMLSFQYLQLFQRPQRGTFENKIPRLIRACGSGVVTCLVAKAMVHNLFNISAGVILLSTITVIPLVLLERYLLFRIELHVARHSPSRNRVLLLGTSDVAATLTQALKADPRLRTRVEGYLSINGDTPDPDRKSVV